MSASKSASGPADATSAASSSTRPSSTRPSNGQPNATLIVTAERIPSVRARSTMRRAPAADSATEAFWFRRLNDSVAPKEKRTSSSPEATSRS